MVLTGDNGGTARKTCHTGIWSTTNPTWTDLRLNPETKCLSQTSELRPKSGCKSREYKRHAKGLLEVELTVSEWVLMEVLGRGLTKFEVVNNCPTRCDYIQFYYIYVNTALRVSGDTFTHHQERLTVFTTTAFHLFHDTSRQQYWWTISDAVNTVKWSRWWAKTSTETRRVD